MPATDTTDFEREFEELVRDLRALPTAASEHVREQVRALGEPAPSRSLRGRLPRLQWRRSLLVLAPACVLGLVTAAVIHGVLNSGPTREAAVTVSGQPSERLEGQSGAEDQAFTTAKPASPFAMPLPVPTADRLQDYEAWMTVRVKDLDALSDQANEAMRLARASGGYVVSLEQATAPGRPGQADLVLRVPVARVEDALMRLAGLGTVIERQAGDQCDEEDDQRRAVASRFPPPPQLIRHCELLWRLVGPAGSLATASADPSKIS